MSASSCKPADVNLGSDGEAQLYAAQLATQKGTGIERASNHKQIAQLLRADEGPRGEGQAFGFRTSMTDGTEFEDGGRCWQRLLAPCPLRSSRSSVGEHYE